MEDKLTFTEENVLVSVTPDQYEKGILVFSSNEGMELGKIKVSEYRAIKKTPYKETSTYLLQACNYLWVCFNILARTFAISPIIYFWFLIFLAAYGGPTGNTANLSGLTISDLYSPIIIFSSVGICLISVIIAGLLRSKIPGYKDYFDMRFRCLLESKIPLIRDLYRYKLSWVKD